MAEPSAQAAYAQHQMQYARPLSALGAPLQRAILQLDGALIARLAEPVAQDRAPLLRLEALLLWRARVGLVAHHREHGAPERVDPVVAEMLLEAIDFASSLVAELSSGGLTRLGRLWQGCREVLTELQMLGVDVHAHKQELTKQRQALSAHTSTLAAAERDAALLGIRLASALGACEPARARAPLEQLLTLPS